MARVHFLGTGAATSEPERTTTMLALENSLGFLLVDCGGDVWQRALASGLEPSGFRGLVVTHEHPDHLSGFPLFMEKLWLLGRREPVPVYGIAPALAQARRSHDAFDTRSWKADGYPDILWRALPHAPGALVLEDEDWRVHAAPGRHPAPVIGLRAEDRRGGGVLAYSCDTEPCEAILELARGAGTLVHEATGAGPGHSSARQAAEVAAAAGAARLLLVHLPRALPETEMAAARRIFAATEKATEGGALEF